MKKQSIVIAILFTLSFNTVNAATFIQSVKLPEDGGTTYRNCANVKACLKKIAYADSTGFTNDCLRVSIIRNQKVVWVRDYTKTPFNHRQEWASWNGPFQSRFPSRR